MSFDHHKQSPEIARPHCPVLSFTHAIVLPIINIADHLASLFLFEYQQSRYWFLSEGMTFTSSS